MLFLLICLVWLACLVCWVGVFCAVCGVLCVAVCCFFNVFVGLIRCFDYLGFAVVFGFVHASVVFVLDLFGVILLASYLVLVWLTLVGVSFVGFGC